MPTSELFVCKIDELEVSKSFLKFFDELKDEVILFLDRAGNIKCFSSVCPHLAGEVLRSDKNDGLYCRWHGLEFDSHGMSINCRARLTLFPYQTVLRDGGVYIIYEL